MAQAELAFRPIERSPKPPQPSKQGQSVPIELFSPVKPRRLSSQFTFKGLTHTPEVRRRIRRAHKGKEKSPETKTKMSLAVRRRWDKDGDLRLSVEGKAHTPKHNKRIGKAIEDKWKNPDYAARVGESIKKAKARKKESEAAQAVIRAEFSLDGDEIRELWEYAVKENILPDVISRSGISGDEFEKIHCYYALGKGKKPREAILDRFTIAVANLA